MMRARRHRPRARDRPRRAPAIDRYDADSFLESESEPPTRARTRTRRPLRARESHTHTHHRRATSRSRPNDSRLATRASTSPAPVPIARARVTTASARVASPRIHTSVSSRLLYDHNPRTPPSDYPYHPYTTTPACTHEDTSTDHDSSSVIHTPTLPRGPSFSTVENPKIHPSSAFDPRPRALARSSSTASSSRVSRARGWGKSET